MRKPRKPVSDSRPLFGIVRGSSCTELWSIFHDELDLDGNGHLDADELSTALSKAGGFPLHLYPFVFILYERFRRDWSYSIDFG